MTWTTPHGYRMLYVNRKMTYEHVFVWEQHNGPVPAGHQIHHIDGDKLNNDISNLACLTISEHRRAHAGWHLVEGEWWKPCTKCGRDLPATPEYFRTRSPGTPESSCRACRGEDQNRLRRKRRAAQRAEREAAA